MQAKRKRLTLDMDPSVQRRLKVMAALKGISMRQYCLTAIGKELTQDEANGALPGRGIDREAIERLATRRRELFGGKALPGSGADLIREAREIRDAQLEDVE